MLSGKPTVATPVTSKQSLAEQVQSALAWLKRHSTKATLDGMARYAIPSDHAYGVAMKDIKALGKTLGRNHPLAVALWATGVYEARMLASFVGDPAAAHARADGSLVQGLRQLGILRRDELQPLRPHAARVGQGRPVEQQAQRVREAHGVCAAVEPHRARQGCRRRTFRQGLALIEREAGDERNFVKKAANMALRAIGKRNRALNAAAVVVARRLADSKDATARWVGKDALRELTSPAVTRRLRR